MATVSLTREEVRDSGLDHVDIERDICHPNIPTRHNREPALKRQKADTQSKTAAQTVQRVRPSIKASSLFSPISWDCPTCYERNNFQARHCHGPGCGRPFEWTNTILGQTGKQVNLARFPVHWACGTCCNIQSVLDIIMGHAACPCGLPTLQAVYDQFGDLFLCWRDDPAIYNLKEMKKVEEAARRLWLAGGDRWEDAMPKIHLDEKKGKGKEEEMVTVLVGPNISC